MQPDAGSCGRTSSCHKPRPVTLTDDLIRALERAINRNPVMIFVEGEEDLAVIPLVIAAPDGAVILYGQPHEEVVLRTGLTRGAKDGCRENS